MGRGDDAKVSSAALRRSTPAARSENSYAQTPPRQMVPRKACMHGSRHHVRTLNRQLPPHTTKLLLRCRAARALWPVLCRATPTACTGLRSALEQEQAWRCRCCGTAHAQGCPGSVVSETSGSQHFVPLFSASNATSSKDAARCQ
jgi:hypothetical protein